MIDRATVQKIKQLLAEKVPHRQIAKRVGISRGTIGLMAKGHEPPQRGRDTQQNKDLAITQQNKDLAMLNRPFLRCPGCGGLCQLEENGKCLACQREASFAAHILAAMARERFRARRKAIE